MSQTNSGNYRLALGLGAAIFVIAFIMLLTLGDYGFIAAFFLALLLALLSTIVLYLAFGMGDGTSPSWAKGNNKPASASGTVATAASTGAATADAGEADAKKADEAKKAAEAEAARNAEEARAAEAAEADAKRKAEEAERAAAAEAARKAEEEAAAATPTASSAADLGEDYDGDGVHEGTDEGTRPAGLDAPRGGQADDLKMIKGIGPKLEKLCNSLGFWHFDQVAAWSSDEVAWVDANLQGFKGRVSRDQWVEQARTLATGGETEFSKRVEDGDVY